MNRLFLSSFSLGLLATLALPADAGAKGNNKGRGQPAALSAPARVAPRSAPRAAMPRQAAIRSAPAVRRSPSVGQMRARQNIAFQRNIAAQQNAVARRNIAVQRNLQRNLAVQRNAITRQNRVVQQRVAQVQASQRRQINQTIVNQNNSRRYAVTRNNYYGGRGYRGYAYANPPLTVYRGWDRGREHYWNNHRYGWRGTSWVALGGYDYPYYNTYAYDESPSVVVSSAPEAVGDSLAADVQSALVREGYDPGPVDGVMGSSTRDAITQFQADHGLAITGTINSALLQSLGL